MKPACVSAPSFSCFWLVRCLPTHLPSVLVSNGINAFWNSVRSGHTLIKLILTLLGDEASEQMCVSFQCGWSLSWVLLISSLEEKHTEVRLYCRTPETAEPCHLHCTPLSNMTNSARGQMTKCVIKYLRGPQTLPPPHIRPLLHPCSNRSFSHSTRVAAKMWCGI